MRSERLGDPAEQLIDAVVPLFKIQPAEQRLKRGRVRVFRDRCRLGHGFSGSALQAVTIDGLLLLGEVGQNVLDGLRLCGGADERDGLTVQIFRCLRAAAGEMGANQYLINGIGPHGRVQDSTCGR